MPLQIRKSGLRFRGRARDVRACAMMRNIDQTFRRALWMALGSVLSGLLAGESFAGAGPQVEMELVSEVREIVPGRPFTVGLRLVHAPQWHTYWKNPGIVGVATSIDWKLPRGWKAGPIQWPQPKVVHMARVKAYGYEEEAILLVDMVPPEQFSESAAKTGEVTLTGRVAYMACATTCHPGFRDVELSLPVAGDEAEGPAWNSRWRPAFEAARATFAEDTPVWTSVVRRVGGDRIRLVLRPTPAPVTGEGPRPNLGVDKAYFFSTDDQVDSDASQRVARREDGTLVLELTASRYGPEAPEIFPGILYSAEGWHAGGDAKAIVIRARWSDSG